MIGSNATCEICILNEEQQEKCNFCWMSKTQRSMMKIAKNFHATERRRQTIYWFAIYYKLLKRTKMVPLSLRTR